jgi:hypothetical protein
LDDSVTEREVGVNFAEGSFVTQNGQLTVAPAALAVGIPLKLNRVVSSQGTFAVSVPTIAGRHYIVEFTDVLPATNWTALPAITGDGTVKSLSDPGAPSRQRFYRLRIE